MSGWVVVVVGIVVLVVVDAAMLGVLDGALVGTATATFDGWSKPKLKPYAATPPTVTAATAPTTKAMRIDVDSNTVTFVESASECGSGAARTPLRHEAIGALAPNGVRLATCSCGRLLRQSAVLRAR